MTIRVFIGIEFEAEPFLQIVEHCTQAKTVSHFHITLKFLGDIQESELDEIKKKLQTIKHDAFTLSFADKFEAFPSLENARVIYVPAIGGELLKLQQKIDKCLQEIFQPEQKFLPHITIARGEKLEVPQVKFYLPEVRITSFSLIQTKLTPKGPSYTKLKSYKL